jgi:hypothetical protein
MVPKDTPNARAVNQELYYLQVTPAGALLNQVKQSYKGIDGNGQPVLDPLIGFTVPGTNLLWENMTEVQKAIFNCAAESGQTVDPMALQGNPGPACLWNQSYTQWGLPGILTQ